ncbi:Imm32 family immunity protein [Undibacterium sp.]|uniref:Imm32 family immunity protein n=1 Tax=Undibacterium sp. TaxID=1914977 RepID=UPI0035212FB2
MIESLLTRTTYDHMHLMTQKLGGKELTDQKQSRDNQTINHVKIFNWIDKS